MWKYAAAIIASALAVWGLGAFISLDLHWIVNTDATDRLVAVTCWIIGAVIACLGVSENNL